jgi:hypothetical protein
MVLSGDVDAGVPVSPRRPTRGGKLSEASNAR